MFEKVNPSHPDKLADRIAGAIVDYVYTQDENPKIAVEVLIGHGTCLVITETSVPIIRNIVSDAVYRILGTTDVDVIYRENKQDPYLAYNQKISIRCGDNGIINN